MGSKKVEYDCTSRLEDKSERKTRKHRRKSMSSVSVASHAAPSFLANLFKEHSITDVNFVPDNAKPRATVPRSVYCQSPKSGRENKSVSRWDSIVRTESQDARDNYSLNRRHSGRRSGEVSSLSPSPLNRVVERWKTPPSNDCQPDKALYEKFNSSAPCLNYRGSYGSSDLPNSLRNDSRKPVATIIQDAQRLSGPLPPPTRQKSDESILGTSSSPSTRKPVRRGSLDAADRPDPVRERSSSEPGLRVPQRRAFIDSQGESGPSKPRRARRRASMDIVPSRKNRLPTKSAEPNASTWWKLGGKDDDGDNDGNGTDSTQELTPSPSTPVNGAPQILSLTSDSIEGPPLNSPPVRRAARRSSMPCQMPSSRKKSTRPKSPPLQQPGTPPSVRRSKRSSRESKKKKKKRSKSPPPPLPDTPPSVKRNHRSRRHSDSIIDIDMEVSENLFQLAQISSPVQPIRRQSFGSEAGSTTANKRKSDLSCAIAIVDFSPDGRDDQYDRASTERQQSISGEVDSSSQKVEGNVPINSEEEEGKPQEEEGSDIHPKPNKVHFISQVDFSPTKIARPKRVSFSPRRMHSEPIAGLDPRKDDDDSALLSPFHRRNPFSPSKPFAKTSLTATKTGALTRSRSNSTRDGGQNRSIIQASLREHSSKGDDFVLEANDSDSSMEINENEAMADMLPPAPSLNTPPQVKKKKKNRRSSLPLAPDLNETPRQTTKKKISRRRSLY